MKTKTFVALAVSLGLAMTAGQAGATVANPLMGAAAAHAAQTTSVTKVWWRGGPGWHGGPGWRGGPGWHGGPGWRGGWYGGWRPGWRPGYAWRPGYGWAPFAAFGAALAATAATSSYYYGPGPYDYGPGPSYGACGGAPCAPAPYAPLK